MTIGHRRILKVFAICHVYTHRIYENKDTCSRYIKDTNALFGFTCVPNVLHPHIGTGSEE